MNNDLISREALKEDFKSRLSICNGWIVNAKDKETKIRACAIKAFISEVIMTVDNAPTVDTYTIEDIQTVREDALLLGAKLAQRPQGKWIEGKNGNIKCNQCGSEIRYSYLIGNKPDFPKFCCECGAKMKGGAE